MDLVIGIGNLLIGLASTGLGLLSAWETFSLRRYRGWSRFGIGFSLMAASCGPHHLIHGWHALQEGDSSWPMLAVTLIGVPAGFIFVGLRTETALGGRGDRPFTSSRYWAVSLVVVFAVAVGWFAGWSVARPAPLFSSAAMCTALGLAVPSAALGAGLNSASLTLPANMFVVVTYGMVGWYLADYQVRRHLAEGSWSLSGVSLSAVFFTCALMHLIYATTERHRAALPFDLLGIPASVYFLWIVKRVHSDSVVDWNRRPLVGAAATPERSAPWR
ncbi:MAG TPA: hypothetical protein VFO44_12800 [Steroidobacteraceae bacterium]|nr:hypothetical protein [Steroidobacteraceae bacterium]